MCKWNHTLFSGLVKIPKLKGVRQTGSGVWIMPEICICKLRHRNTPISASEHDSVITSFKSVGSQRPVWKEFALPVTHRSSRCSPSTTLQRPQKTTRTVIATVYAVYHKVVDMITRHDIWPDRTSHHHPNLAGLTGLGCPEPLHSYATGTGHRIVLKEY